MKVPPGPRVCREHGAVCEGAAPGRSVWCQGGAGHIVRWDDLDVVVEASPQLAPEGESDMPRGVKGSGPKAKSMVGRTETFESIAFVDASGAKMRISVRRDGTAFQVFVLYLDGKSKRSGVLDGSNCGTEPEARRHYEAAIERAKRKQWQQTFGRRHREGLHDIPDAKPAPGVRRTA